MTRPLRPIALLLWSFLLWNTPAWAVPTLTYDGPWQVTISTSSNLGNCPPQFFQFDGYQRVSAPQSFPCIAERGISSVDVPKVNASAGGGGGGFSIDVSATRPFTLNDSPAGWRADLGGLLTGQVSNGFLVFNATTVGAGLTIDNGGVQWGDSNPVANTSKSVNEFEETILEVSNGSHTLGLHVRGFVFSVGGVATATLFPNISITPIPEAATWLLLVSGMAGLVLWRRRQLLSHSW
jgi:hypothetical protein